MLIQCIQSIGQQITKESVYLVIEVYVNAKRPEDIVHYRVIDDDGYPAIYSAKYFEVVSNKTDGLSLTIKEDGIVLAPETILLSPLNKKSINGFWDCYFESPQDWSCAKQTLEEVVSQLSEIEGGIQTTPLANLFEAT